MSVWERTQELVIEVGLRLAKLLLASALAAVLYFVLTNVVGAPGSVQLALECWLAAGLAILLLETGIF
jgi:hypothetical protein